MSEDAKQYRRMRDLNNAASKRCRVGRKRKSEVHFFIINLWAHDMFLRIFCIQIYKKNSNAQK